MEPAPDLAGLQRFPDRSLALAIGLQRRVFGIKTKAEDMNKAALQQAADLDATPELRRAHPALDLLLKPALDWQKSCCAVVIGDRKMLQANGEGLLGQGLRREAAIAVCGVAVEIQPRWAAFSRDGLQDRNQGMAH
jgi:hypothetical protein